VSLFKDVELMLFYVWSSKSLLCNVETSKGEYESFERCNALSSDDTPKM
jgi:hypothetical protein